MKTNPVLYAKKIVKAVDGVDRDTQDAAMKIARELLWLEYVQTPKPDYFNAPSSTIAGKPVKKARK